MSVDPRFERAVLAELALRERQSRARALSSDRSARARMLAERLHRGRHDLLLHLRCVALTVPTPFRAVAWLHHAHEADASAAALDGARLTAAELAAIQLFADLSGGRLDRARALSRAPESAGHLARVVARAAIVERLRGERPDGAAASALVLLGAPEVAR